MKINRAPKHSSGYQKTSMKEYRSGRIVLMFWENCSSTDECNFSAFPPLETAMDMNFIWDFQCWMMYSQNNIIKGCVSVLCLLLFMIAALWQTQPKTQINYSSLCMCFSPQWKIQKYPLWYWLKKEACACKPIFLLLGCVKEQEAAIKPMA